MSKLYSPDGACKSMSVVGARSGRQNTYDMQHDGAFHVESPEHHKALKQMGCFEHSTRVGTKGYRCNSCGFLAVFPKSCGRCGGDDLVLEGA